MREGLDHDRLAMKLLAERFVALVRSGKESLQKMASFCQQVLACLGQPNLEPSRLVVCQGSLAARALLALGGDPATSSESVRELQKEGEAAKGAATLAGIVWTSLNSSKYWQDLLSLWPVLDRWTLDV